MTAEEILLKYIDETDRHTLNIGLFVLAMEEYGKQCYIQGSNDCHKAMIDNLPDEMVEQLINETEEDEE